MHRLKALILYLATTAIAIIIGFAVATINMAGTVLYMDICSPFIANVFGIDLTMGQIAMIVFTGTLTSIYVQEFPALV